MVRLRISQAFSLCISVYALELIGVLYHFDPTSSRRKLSQQSTVLHKKVYGTLHLSNTTASRFRYPDARTRFPLPAWLDQFLQSQPKSTHMEKLLDPNAKFLVMTCHLFKETLPEDCGGISDRLYLVPYYLWLAHRTGRIFAIRYSQPHPLEELLIPPDDGFDWTLPDGVIDAEWEAYANRSFAEYYEQRRFVWHAHIDKPKWNNTRVIFANTNLVIPKVAPYSLPPNLNLDDAWPGIFRRMFQPSPGLATMIDTWADQHQHLVPGSYSAAHVRAKFPVGETEIKLNVQRGDTMGGGLDMKDPGTRASVQQVSSNAVQCAWKANHDTKYIYFASDSNEMTKFVLTEQPLLRQQGGSDGVPIIARPNGGSDEPVHFQRHDTTPQDLYPAIFDLWVMAHAKCMAQGYGGFAHFASQLSGYHYSCRVLHRSYTVGVMPLCPKPGQEKRDVETSMLLATNKTPAVYLQPPGREQYYLSHKAM